MVCKVCGRTIANEEANFCEYCGASFRSGVENIYPEFHYQNTNNNQNNQNNNQNNNRYNGQNTMGNMQGNTAYGRNPFQGNGNSNVTDAQGEVSEKPMTFGNWMMVMILPFIPMIGPIAYLAVLFMWSFGVNTPTTRKNWARATLVMLVVALFFVFAVFGSFTNVMSSLGTI